MKLFLGSVLYHNVHVAYAESMALLQRELDKRGIAFTYGAVSGDALISRSRSIVGSAFLRSDCDVLLTIDSDIWFRPQDAIRLCEQAAEKHIIGALYMTRSLQTQPALMLPEGESVAFAAGVEAVSVPFLSTGFMAVHRDVFQSLSLSLPLCHRGWSDRGQDTSFWPFYMPFTIPWEGDGHMYLSEDWAFCQRAKDKGYNVWLDPGIRLGHMGDVMFTMEDLIRAPRPEAQPLRLERDAQGQLVTFTREPVPSS